ncbi:cytochrome P450 [Microbacteriaceae bacterium K1510]|nr:cytochrome P450 [Microbacteriaceae bacterium K1510]
MFENAGSTRARDFNLFAVPEEYYDNPAPYFRLLRDHDPVHTNADGSLLLTQFHDVRQVWRDLSGRVDKTDSYRAKFGEGLLLEHHTSTMLFRDPPDHDRLRAIVNPFFSQASIASLKGFVEEKVAQLLDEVAKKREIDFVADFAFQLPVAVICRILGVPQSDAGLIQEMGRKILFPLNPKVDADVIAAGHKATADFKAYLLDFVRAARTKSNLDPRADIISALVVAERSGAQISENEILHMCIVILNGGHETTTNLISQSVNALLNDAAALAEVRDEKVDISAAIEELIRFITPLQLQGRRTTQPVVLESGNGEIPPNTEVILCQASANRDDRVFSDPDRLNLSRKPNSHVAFGGGIHVCIGRPLARLEASIAVPAFVRRFAAIERTGPANFNRNVRFRGLQAMPLRVD